MRVLVDFAAEQVILLSGEQAGGCRDVKGQMIPVTARPELWLLQAAVD